LGYQADLASELSFAPELLAPLPAQLLGLDPTSDFAVHSLKPRRGDRIVLVSRSYIPANIYSLPYGGRSLDDISRALADTDSRTPFWLGEFTIR
jgi:hypothetical protein